MRAAGTPTASTARVVGGDSGGGYGGGHRTSGRDGREPWPWENGFTGELQGACGYKRPAHFTDSLRERALDAATAKGDRGRNSTGTRAWFKFTESLGQRASRPLDTNAPLWVKLEEETLAMQFVCALVEVRGVQPTVAANYFSQAQTWHKLEAGVKIAGGLKMERLAGMLKGIRRIVGDAPKRIRRGVAPQAMRKAMDLLLDPNDPADANIRAALATAFQGLLRVAEYTSDAKKFNTEKSLTRADIERCDEKMLVMMIHPCKNMIHVGGKTCPLVIGAGGKYIDAVREMRNMLRVDPTPAGEAMSTPLFRVPATGLPLRDSDISIAVKRCMVSVGEDPAQFASHSLRIGGATALFAAGADCTVIRTMGRWSSDLYRLYVRACFEKSIEWSRRCGSTSVQDLAGVADFDEVEHY